MARSLTIRHLLLLFCGVAPLCLPQNDSSIPKIEGRVVDATTGAPVQGARFNIGITEKPRLTGIDGTFSLVTSDPSILIRKAGYKTARIRTDGQVTPVEVLLPRHSNPVFPVCKKSRPRARTFAIQFPDAATKHLKKLKPGADVDYVIQAYAYGDSTIAHGAGPNWSWGEPDVRLIRDSDHFEEVSYIRSLSSKDQSIELPIFDSRGKLHDGTYWRFLGTFGETVSYRGVNQAAAQAFDKLLNSACLVRN